MRGVSDEELLASALSDPDAFAELYRRWFPRLVDYAEHHGLQRHDAEDIAQTTLLRVWEHRGRPRPATVAFTAYVKRIACNLIVDRGRHCQMRSRVHQYLYDSRPETPRDVDVLSRLVRDEAAAAWRASIAQLPGRQRLALEHLAVSDAETLNTAAEELGWNLSTFKAHVHRGRRSMAHLAHKQRH